ncbi:hypothetical protein F8M41_018817 [Gigaspora margarita]|uniref:Uncharacterized protein n=1 Tax=Gigaspora margarita TaxID=4874 RepID=A0A8H3ZUK8_GIGMA|nr:hypothetical protein F8M41_018817 [Gigaspora margarita]
MLQSKNNLQELSLTGYITEFSYNFTISPVIIKHQTVWVRRSIQSKLQTPKYVFKWTYVKKKSFYYCKKCNAFQQFKICRSCENKFLSPNDFDAQSYSSTISSGSEIQLNRESENNQLELEHNQSPQSHETNHQIIIDLPHKDKHEVIVEMNKWEHAVRNDMCGKLINSFGYISNQNGYVRNLDNEVYFSDNDLRMDSDFSNNSN